MSEDFVEFIKTPTQEAYKRIPWQRLRDYLIAHGWSHVSTWRYADFYDHAKSPFEVCSPITNDITDYARRVNETIITIAETESITVWDAYVAVRDFAPVADKEGKQ